MLFWGMSERPSFRRRVESAVHRFHESDVPPLHRTRLASREPLASPISLPEHQFLDVYLDWLRAIRSAHMPVE